MKARLGGNAETKKGKLIVGYVVQTAIFKIVGRLTIPQLQFNDLHKFVTPLVYISLQHLSATPKLHWLKI